jgi:hypothetical protein
VKVSPLNNLTSPGKEVTQQGDAPKISEFGTPVALLPVPNTKASVTHCRNSRLQRPSEIRGENGIRTHGTGLSPYTGLANRRLQPLGHLSNRDLYSIDQRRMGQYCRPANYWCHCDGQQPVFCLNVREK